MKRITITLALAAILPLAAEDKKAHVLLQAAQAKETVQGDLKGAIELYGQAVKEAGANRALAAKTLVRIAECYQKLGDAESRKIYEQVVRDYADQKDAVTLARTRLGRDESLARQGGLALRKVWAGDTSGTISPDGRRLTYVDWKSLATADWGRLLLHDVASGVDRELTSRKEGWTYGSAISRDGGQVAYTWIKSSDNAFELRIVSLQGNGMPPSRRLFGNEDVRSVTPHDWSPDGKWIAATVQRKDHTAQIGLVSVQDGSLRVLKSVDWRGPTRIFFSPDGQQLAFDLPVSENSEQRDVFVLAVDGSYEVPAVAHPSEDVVMGWSPDGKYLLFASDRGGSMGLWALAFAGARPQGAPELVKADIGSTWSMGVTSAGALYMGVGTGDRHIEVASIDLNTGKQTVPAIRPIQKFVGSNWQPNWSPDGKYLAYVTFQSDGRSLGDRTVETGSIVIRSVETGQVRELPMRPRLSYFNSLSWAPDGRFFAVVGTDLKGRDGVFRIDARTGEVAPLVVPTPERLSYEGIFWSPDGKRIYYHSQKGAIYERELASGKEREIIRGNLGPISLSPDGHWIATAKKEPLKPHAVVLVPVEGGEPRELLRVGGSEWLNNAAMPWTPDGRGVLVRKMWKAGGKITSEIWLSPIDGAAARKLDFDASRMSPYAHGQNRLHPDGHQLAYVTGELGGEVWVLENFLPTLSAKK